MEADVLRLIEARMSGFSKGQKLIGTYMLQHYEKAAYMTASRLGATVGVSESTVVRFADELGFDGYPELQKSLQELIRNKLTALQRIEVSDFRIGDGSVPEKILASDMEKIRYTLEHLNGAAFEATVDAPADHLAQRSVRTDFPRQKRRSLHRHFFPAVFQKSGRRHGIYAGARCKHACHHG